MPHSRFLLMLALLALCPAVSLPQRRGGDSRQAPPTHRPPSRTPTAAEAQYWAAQRGIETAIQQLEAYLREYSDGARSATARQQLEVLRSLTITASRPEWALLGSMPLRDVPEWRVASVDPQPEKTRLAVEIACRREDGGDCYFFPFERRPLVLVDQQGRFYPMLESGALPPDVHRRDREERLSISGGRTVTVTVDFAPLAAGVVSGQVYYRDNNQARPARFSLAPRR
jgi:hypothetical protein